MKTLTVALPGREYDILIGRGLLAQAGKRVKAVLPRARKLAVVTDSNVSPLYSAAVLASLAAAGFDCRLFVVPAGEESKNPSQLAQLWEGFMDFGLTRTDGVIALGGGVVGDLAGFAAATILRGVALVQIPTTLLSQVDSSVGGKVAVDLAHGKNLAGAFMQPSAVLCDTDCLKTLPPDVFADGAAEAIKTGILCSEKLFALFETDVLSTAPEAIISRCVTYKAGVVERDEKEQGERKLLNLGHTIGHAIEKCSDFTIPHGHAVAAGLAIMARAAEKLGWTDGPAAGRIAACLEKNHLPVRTNFEPRALALAALSDKKRAGDSITIVVPKKFGHCELKKVHVSDLEAIIRAGVE